MARTFVLVHCGWCGAWVWRDVLSGLRKLGHNVNAPTLTGLGERQRCGVATADLGTHIEDLVSPYLDGRPSGGDARRMELCGRSDDVIGSRP